MTTVPWSDLQKAAGEAGFDPVPAGTYDVVIDTAQAKTAATGKNMIAVKFKVENGPQQGKTIFNQFVLSPDSANALAFFFRHMTALGLGEAYFAAQPPLERVAGDLIGRRCQVQVSIRQWQGTDRNQVEAVAPPVGGPGAAPAPAGLPGMTPGGAPAGPAPGVPATSPAPAGLAPAPPAPPASSPRQSPPPAVPQVPVTVPSPAPSPTPPPPPGMGDDDLPF